MQRPALAPALAIGASWVPGWLDSGRRRIATTFETLLASPDEADHKRTVILPAKERSAHIVDRIRKLAEGGCTVDGRFLARRVLGYFRPGQKPDRTTGTTVVASKVPGGR